MIFDTHSHCYWESLLPRIEEVLANMKKARVEKTVAIGCDIETSKQAIALADRYPEVFFATVGLHPETAQNTNEYAQSEFFEKFILDHRERIVAVGETGLDFHYLDGSLDGTKRVDIHNLSKLAKEQIENQKNWWRIHFELGEKYSLPLVIHTRDARDATLEFMKDEGIGRAVMHCFSEDWEFARELMDLSDDIYFSFSGIVTYKNAQKIQEAAKKSP